jgi:hypothetical protein
MTYTLKQILSLSSTTTPKLVTAQLNADPTYGTGYGYGRPLFQQVFVQAVRANGSAITGVTFKVQGARDPQNPVWFDIPVAFVTDPSGTLATSNMLSVANNSTAESALITESLIGIPLVRVLAQAVAADAVAGDSCTAWVWS